ncbi:hypothetical protein ACFL5E_00125 [Candidatus Omnitrophota bacterium]
MDNDSKDWIYSLKNKASTFMEKMKVEEPGFYRYSMSGDVLSPKVKWGLGNSVFAAKILYMLDRLTDEDREEISSFIRSFQDGKGEIYDPAVQRLSWRDRWSRPLTSLDFGNVLNARTRRAETRQAFAALMCLGRQPGRKYAQVPGTMEEVERYILLLDWKRPWGAASHVSHLAFFLKANDVLCGQSGCGREELMRSVFDVTGRFRQTDGSWYEPRPGISSAQKVNAAMKMLTAYAAADKWDFGMEKELIDLCLLAVNDSDACGNLNIVLVLYYCSKRTDHRATEIRRFCEDRLKIYRRHYWPEYGGFSFYGRKANDVYYGAKISHGLTEPDIHGTTMFLWGIAMISEILELKDDVGLKFPIT